MCVSVSWFIYFFTEAEEASIRVSGGYCHGTHRDTIKLVLSFNPGAATDNSGSGETWPVAG